MLFVNNIYNKSSERFFIAILIISVFLCIKSFQGFVFGTENRDMQSETSDELDGSEEESEESETSESTETSEEEQKSESENSSYSIYSLLSSDVKAVFDLAEPDKLSEKSEELSYLYDYLSTKYSSSSNLQDIADMSILNFLTKNDLATPVTQRDLLNYVQNYKDYQKNKYDDEKYASMDSKSHEFALSANKTGNCPPENVIIIPGGKALNNYPVTYDENILISLDDAINILDINPEIEYMDNNANIIVKFGDNSLVIVPGKNFVDMNDRRVVLDNPVLNIEGVTYVPVGILDVAGCEIIKCDDSVVIY